MSDAVFFVLLAVLLIGSWALMRGRARALWMGLFVGVFVLMALAEGVSVLTTKLTLSQHFWKFSETNAAAAWAILAALLAGWLLILWHLARKLIERRKLK